MAKTPKSPQAGAYKSVGTTYDGVRVLEPKLGPQKFTRQQIRSTINKVMSERASSVHPTQGEAIARARELAPSARPSIERVRPPGGGKPDKWRKA